MSIQPFGWCHPTISSSVVPLSSCLQSFPASGSFPVSQFFASGSQSPGASASASVLPMNIQDGFPLGWISWISLQSKRLKSLLQHRNSRASILWCSGFFIGEGNGNPLQYSCLENPMDTGAWFSKESDTTARLHFNRLCLWSNSHIHTWLLGKPLLWLDDLCWQSDVPFLSLGTF